MNLLLTGGAGYVGSACLRWLLQRGHNPIAYDNLSTGNADAVPGDRLVRGEIEDGDALRRAMREHEIDAVMHFAALASVPESIDDPESYYRVNIEGTKSVLDAMRDTNVKRIVFSSTAATYGFHTQMPLTEDTPQTPQVPYGSTKLAAEWLLKDYAKAYGMGCALLRYFNASGADEDGQHGECREHECHLIPLTLAVAVGRREKLLIYGNDYDTRDGTCVRDYVHVADLAQAHELALQKLDPGVTLAYNLGCGDGTTVMEVLRACEQVVGKPIAHELVGRRRGDPDVLVASPDRIIRELDWAPRFVSISTIVETAWRWHQSHPDGYATKAGSRSDAQAHEIR